VVSPLGRGAAGGLPLIGGETSPPHPLRDLPLTSRDIKVRYWYSPLLMQIDENTPGSLANQEVVRVLKGWLLAFYVVDAMLCFMWGLGKGLSMTQVFWLLFQSLFFSYFVGTILLIIVIRYFGRLIGLQKITLVGFLRFCILFALISVIMGATLVYHAPVNLSNLRDTSTIR
jgi:hypothetical protein